jgi:hypothetical protein
MRRSLDRGPRRARCSPDGVEGAKDGAPDIVQRVRKGRGTRRPPHPARSLRLGSIADVVSEHGITSRLVTGFYIDEECVPSVSVFLTQTAFEALADFLSSKCAMFSFAEPALALRTIAQGLAATPEYIRADPAVRPLSARYQFLPCPLDFLTHGGPVPQSNLMLAVENRRQTEHNPFLHRGRDSYLPRKTSPSVPEYSVPEFFPDFG